MSNPWEEIRLDDYENHMHLDSVRQLQTMNTWIAENLLPEALAHKNTGICDLRHRLQSTKESNSQIYSDWLFYAESGRC